MLLIGLSGKAGHGKDTVADYLVEQYGFLKFGFADPLYREVATAFGLTEDEAKHYLHTRGVREQETARFALEKCASKAFISRLVDLGLASGPEALFEPRSPRQIMIWWGTEYRRGDDPDYWVKKAAMFVNAFCESRKRKVETVAESHHVAQQLGCDEADDKHSFHPMCGLGSEYYEEFPGLVNINVRFENEAQFIRDNFGSVWRIDRPNFVQNEATANHSSEQLPTLRTGDKLLINSSSVDRLRTAVSIMLRGEVGIVNAGDQDDEEAAVKQDEGR